MNTFYIISLGCAKNQCDSERLIASLTGIGLDRADTAEQADILIINTCGFIESAKQESIEVILDAADLRDSGKRVVVLGCLTERYREDIARDMPEIDMVYGLYDDAFAARLIERFGLTAATGGGGAHRIPLERGAFEYIKIAEGCSNGCNYCAIPLIRGAHRSFAPELILTDAREAVSRGASELIIVAQDIAQYQHGGVELPELVNRIADIPGVRWIRLMYLHPDHITDAILNLYAAQPKVVPYIDIPFQHASAGVLKLMNRAGDAARYTALIERLRETRPDMAIRSTFMVGHPGETEDDFRILMDFLRKNRLDRVGAFMYSPEEGTVSAGFERPAPRTVKKRYAELMETQMKISAQRMEERVGTYCEALVEERVDESTWACRTVYDAPEVDGVLYLSAPEDAVSLNGIYRVHVTGSTEYDLMGEL